MFNGLFSLFSKSTLNNLIPIKIMVEVIVSLVFTTVISGTINARFPRIKVLDLNVDKPMKQDSLTIVCVSDVHLGSVVGERKVARLVKIKKAPENSPEH